MAAGVMSDIEAWLDVMPGESRGVIARAGRFEHLFIHRDDDPPVHRLGARVIGRVVRVDLSLNGAFVELGHGALPAFLPIKAGEPLVEGAGIEAVVTAEPRRGKGPVLRMIGAAEGQPRLLSPGPDLISLLERHAPGVAPMTGTGAIQAVRQAEEDALSSAVLFADQGVDLAVERTRAMIAVDVDYVGARGRDTKRDRNRANLFAINQAARMIRLKGWGGLVSIDLAGTRHDGDAMIEAARRAFATETDVVIGPITRFGVFQLSLPWRWTPIEERLLEADGQRSLPTRALDIVRGLNYVALSNRSVPAFTARCSPEEAKIAAPFAARLGPRAIVRADPSVTTGAAAIEELQ